MLLMLSACATLNSPVFADSEGAIRGYDPVAYHTEGMAVKGDPAYSFEYNNAEWHFSSAENLALFQANPDRYAPQYGGYCAYGMSKGYVVSTDPKAWTIVHDKLYLNYSLSVRDTWLDDVPGHIAKADSNLLKKLSQPVFE
jgi:YHS domain-containing protein